MRTEQNQLIDLTNAILKGIRDIRRRRLIKYAYPIILKGEEGVILRNLLELMAAGDKDKPNINTVGTVSFEKSLILCSKEFPLPSGDINPFS
ncbi:MAG TPA: hypothetical protein ENI23_07840 [bacterium]|nr:hypothetical protein [bacterium]